MDVSPPYQRGSILLNYIKTFYHKKLSTLLSVLLVNLCGRESLCDIRQDCCYHFVSERDFGRDAQRICQAERPLMSPLARMKRAS